MTNQTMMMPIPQAIAGRTHWMWSGRAATKRDTFMIVHSVGSARASLRCVAAYPVTQLGTVIVPELVVNSQAEDVTPQAADGVGETTVASEKLAAIRAFKGGAALLAAGAVAATVTFAVSAPFLPGVSAVLTVAGGALAAGATERYRRGG